MSSKVLMAIVVGVALGVVAPRLFAPANAQPRAQQQPLTLSRINIAEKKTGAVPPGV